MAIYLDYYIRTKQEGILSIGIMDSDENFREYRKEEISDAINDLAGIATIITFKRSIYNIVRAAKKEGIAHLIDDYDMRDRWEDIYTIIRKQTDGETPSFSRVARSTLGTGPQSKIIRLQEMITVEDDIGITEQIREKTKILKQLHEYAIQHGQLSFTKRNETIWAEVNIRE